MSPTDDSDCAIWIWGLGSSFCEIRFLLVLPLVPVRDVKSCPFEMWHIARSRCEILSL
jgi:hypothetical protein